MEIGIKNESGWFYSHIRRKSRGGRRINTFRVISEDQKSEKLTQARFAHKEGTKNFPEQIVWKDAGG